jgi:cytochrome c2
MFNFNFAPFIVVWNIALAFTTLAQAQDPDAGARLFRMDCSGCHSPQPGRNLIGPSLFNVVNRHSGQVPNFRYSDANRNSGLTWTIPILDRYLRAPRELVPGTKMTFPGVKDPKQRADLIAYLETAHSADPDQPFRPIAITDSGDPDHAVHDA